MVTITEDDIVVEAETVAKAQRKLAKAKKAKIEAQRQADKDHETARQKAYAIVGNLCAMAWDGDNHNGDLPMGFRLYDYGTDYCPVHRAEDQPDSYTVRYRINRPDEIAYIGWYGWRVISALADGGLWCRALMLRDDKGNEQWVSVAAHNGQSAYVYLPTILVPVIEACKPVKTEQEAIDVDLT